MYIYTLSNICFFLQNINKFLLFSFLSFFLSSTCGYNNPRFFTPAYSHLLLFLASAHRLSLLLFTSFVLFSLSLPSSLFFLAHSCSLFPSRDTYSHSSSPRTCRPSSSLHFVDVPPLHFYSDFASSSSLFFSRHLVSPKCHPSSSFIFLSHFMLLFLCFVLAYLSFFASRLMLPLAHISDLVVFALSFHPPRLSLSILVSSSLFLPFALEAHFPLLSLH